MPAGELGADVMPAGEVVARAPGRVNLIGEHTDYNDGLVLPMAIDRGVTATVTPRADGRYSLASRQVAGDPVVVDDLTRRGLPDWAAYGLGAVWAVTEATGPGPGLDIMVDGDVPLGAGLSSSAAVECAVATAVVASWQREVTPRQLARLAQRAENEFVGVPTGSMDQVASVMGRRGCAVLFDVLDDTVEHLELAAILDDAVLLVVDSQAPHRLVDGGYAARRAQCEAAARALGVRSLREVADAMTAARHLAGEPEVLTRRMRHVVSEIDRVRLTRQAILDGDAGAVGRLMVASHRSLRDDFEVSCAELDAIVTAALDAGALGARMTGGGFGGSAIALTPRAVVASVEERICGAFADREWPEPRIWAVAPADGARVVSCSA